MLSDRDARQILSEAFRRVMGREGTRCELQCLQAVAWLETSYAAGWKPPGAGSWNWGACQAGSGWRGATFTYTDTHPTATGANIAYTVKFRAYPSAIEGALDLVRIVYVNAGRSAALAAASREDTAGFSKALHDTGYYEGFGATVGERIAHHHDAVVKAIRRQVAALGEPLPHDIAAMPVLPPTVRLGDGAWNRKAADVRRMQEALAKHGARITIDGGFGKSTLAELKHFQATRGLVPDGVCGPKTWLALEAA